LKAYKNTVRDESGKRLIVSIPETPKKQQDSNSTWEGEYHGDKLYVAGIPKGISKAEVLDLFQAYGDAEVEMMQNSAFVTYGAKRDAERASRGLHKRYSFPGSTRRIYVRFARKLPNDATSANMVGCSLNFAHCFLHSI
jgi:hypothetical protein